MKAQWITFDQSVSNWLVEFNTFCIIILIIVNFDHVFCENHLENDDCENTDYLGNQNNQAIKIS